MYIHVEAGINTSAVEMLTLLHGGVANDVAYVDMLAFS
jgi:hypothetical protein